MHRCRHCKEKIKPNPNGGEFLAWLHVKTDSAECRRFYAAPDDVIHVNVSEPSPRVVYVPIGPGRRRV